MAKHVTRGRVGGPGTTEFIGFDSPPIDFASPQNRTTPDNFATPSFGQDVFGGSSIFDNNRARENVRLRAAVSGGGGARGPVQTGTKTTEFGRADFDAALIDWNRVYTEAAQGLPAALELIDQFAPGGGFGAGLRQEATELVEGGVARDTASAVASGASSISSARGLSVLAGSELSKRFANIEDLRAQLQIGAFSPFTQMLSNLASVGTRRPTTGQFIERITTPTFSGEAAVGGKRTA